MKYNYLPEHLHPVADAVAKYLRDNRGLTGFIAEAEVFKQLSYRPTLQCRTRDGYFVCVEVLDEPYNATLDAVIADCIRDNLPIKLYVAYPEASVTNTATYKSLLERAERNGLGVIELKSTGVHVIHDPCALSLVSVRAIDKKRYPPKYRDALSDAEATFKRTSPVKGCSLLFDEIEHLSRRIAEETKLKGYWRKLKHGEKPPKINLKNGAWQRVIETLDDHLVRSKFPGLTKPLIGRLIGIIPFRNESGHKPSSLAAIIRRQNELRTRFESASDLLFDLIQASKALKL
jgi:hypothetical protein